MSFQRRLKARGWRKILFGHIFTSAHEKITSRPRHNYELETKDGPQSLRDQLILYLQYHPSDLPQRQLRKLYQCHFEDIFDNTLGIKRTIVAYHQPHNLRDLLQNVKLLQKSGNEVSTYFGDQLDLILAPMFIHYYDNMLVDTRTYYCMNSGNRIHTMAQSSEMSTRKCELV